MFLKVQIITYQNKYTQKVMGEGSISTDKNSIGKKVKILIRNKKTVWEQAFCSIEILISGHRIKKHVKPPIDVAKRRIVRLSSSSQKSVDNESEDSVISFCKDALKKQSDSRKQISSTLMFDDMSETALISRQKAVRESDPVSNQKLSLKKGVFSSVLQNKVYLNKRESIHEDGKDIKFPQISPLSQKEQLQINADHLRSKDTDQSSSPSKVQEKFIYNEQLMKKLDIFLSKQEEKQPQVDSKHMKHKIRRKRVSIQDSSQYSLRNTYIKYFNDNKDDSNLLMRNFSVIRKSQNHLKDSRKEEIVPIKIQNLVISNVTKQKILSFDGQGYSSYYFQKDVNFFDVDLKIPSDSHGLKILLSLKSEGLFEGTLGVQEGEQMIIKLHPLQDKLQESNIITTYLFKFDIIHEKLLLKSRVKVSKEDESIGKVEEGVFNSDIKMRIKSFGLQPWAYAESQTKGEPLGSPSTLLERLKVNSISIKNESGYPSSLESSVKNINNSRIQEHTFASPSAGLKNQSKPFKKSFITEYSEEQTNKTMKSKDSDQNERSLKSKKQTQEIQNINKIRNGNRHNYRFKEKTDLIKAPNIKQKWQKLLTKPKAVDEDCHNIQSRHRKTSLNNSIPKYRTNFKTDDSHERYQEKTSLTSSFSDAKELARMSPHSQDKKMGPLSLKSKRLTLSINNISITQPIVDEDSLNTSIGKFIKLTMHNKPQFYTEIIQSGDCSSILWKLSGCQFQKLSGNQHLQIQVYSTIDNKIQLIGKVSIRVSKLHYLRKNHIFNGFIVYDKVIKGQFTMGFQIQESYSFQIIKEEEEVSSFKRQPNNRTVQHQKLPNIPLKNYNRTNHAKYPSFSSQPGPRSMKEIDDRTDLPAIFHRPILNDGIDEEYSEINPLPLGLKSFQ